MLAKFLFVDITDSHFLSLPSSESAFNNLAMKNPSHEFNLSNFYENISTHKLIPR
jgi:hypothetical protein